MAAFCSKLSLDISTHLLSSVMISPRLIHQDPRSTMAEAKQTADCPDFDLSTLFEPPLEIVCSAEDVILKVDDGFHPVTRLLVSKAILKMFSPVFKAILDGGFAEGQIGGEILNGIKVITLKEDNPRSVQVLCHLTHFVPVEKVLGIAPDILDYAILVDNYRCAGTLHFLNLALVRVHLQEYDRNNWSNLRRMFEMTAASFILKYHGLFRHLTALLVRHAGTRFEWTDFRVVCHDLPPKGLVASLNGQVLAARNALSHNIETLVATFNYAAPVLLVEPLIPELLRRLNWAGVFPLNHNDPRMSIGALAARLKRVEIPALPDGEPCTCHLFADLFQPEHPARARMARAPETLADRDGTMHAVHCTRVLIEGMRAPLITQDHVRDVVKNVLDVTVGICMHCITDDRPGVEHGWGKAHPHPWENRWQSKKVPGMLEADVFVDLEGNIDQVGKEDESPETMQKYRAMKTAVYKAPAFWRDDW